MPRGRQSRERAGRSAYAGPLFGQTRQLSYYTGYTVLQREETEHRASDSQKGEKSRRVDALHWRISTDVAWRTISQAGVDNTQTKRRPIVGRRQFRAAVERRHIAAERGSRSSQTRRPVSIQSRDRDADVYLSRGARLRCPAGIRPCGDNADECFVLSAWGNV